MTDASKGKLVLVTGASGFIAGHCIRELLEHGYRVRGTVRKLADAEKVEHLRRLAEGQGASIEFVEADLSADNGWGDAVAGCAFVEHVASPFPTSSPKHEDELVRPAVDGALRVLSACADSGTVKRVVMTSSVAAVAAGRERVGDDGRVLDEGDWSTVGRCPPYPKSKTLAEQAAWKFIEGLPERGRLELAVINPGFVLGPLLNADPGTSGELVRKLIAREMPACPRIGFATVDVRDIAVAHRLAMESPNAAGKRFICAGEHVWIQDIARILAGDLNTKGFRVPTGKLPYWLMWIIARFDAEVRLGLDYVGRSELVSAERAKRELGWSMRPLEETVLATGRSIVEQGLVQARS